VNRLVSLNWRTQRVSVAVWLAWLIFFTAITVLGWAQEWSVPIAGNAFRTAPAPGNSGFGRNPFFRWTSAEDQISIFFRVNQPSDLQLFLIGTANREIEIKATLGDQKLTSVISGEKASEFALGSVSVQEAGYVRVDLRIPDFQAGDRLNLEDLLVRSADNDLKLDFVTTNEGNMFYWGRRGPSVHLTYTVPRDQQIEYAYSEIRVDEGDDPIGSYYMANGFAEGYFGMQVNSSTERRVLFSVWSPFQTDNPREIPPEQRIEALARGPEVRIGEFGNEGSGGQSFLVYPWKTGKTYRFLTQVIPTGDGSSIYTAWFGDKAVDEWRLIASFRRPQTDTYYRRFHSFLESFDPASGHLPRQGNHLNVWVRSVDGQWHECTEARLSVDATGSGRHRLDYNGGVTGQEFFMRNCGFFPESGRPGTLFTRQSSADQHPVIDFDQLPRQSAGLK
jgi:hypothetical protein